MKHEPGHFFDFFQFVCREAVTGRNFGWRIVRRHIFWQILADILAIWLE
jgi:hypothetical protein